MERRFPRLKTQQAKLFVAKFPDSTLEDLRASSFVLPDLATEKFSATGMPRVSVAELKSIQQELRSRMESAGFPEGGLEARASVDKAIAKCLVELQLPVGEMLRPDVWTWLTIHLLPDYLSWRWTKQDGSITEARFCGSTLRNALGRLWLRGIVFDQGTGSSDRWNLMEKVPEDATVAILERTMVSADHRLAKAVAKAWLDTGFKGTAAEELLRDAMILLRVQAALIETSSLDEIALSRFAGRVFGNLVEGESVA